MLSEALSKRWRLVTGTVADAVDEGGCWGVVGDSVDNLMVLLACGLSLRPLEHAGMEGKIVMRQKLLLILSVGLFGGVTE